VVTFSFISPRGFGAPLDTLPEHDGVRLRLRRVKILPERPSYKCYRPFGFAQGNQRIHHLICSPSLLFHNCHSQLNSRAL
jgi:hypothetical protein